METIVYIKEHGFKALTDNLGIVVREYPEHGLYKLNYSQIDSPKTHPVVMECRGLLIDSDLNVVSRTFDRFFNFGEAGTESFDFSNAVCLEKCDGSLVAVYWCPHTGQWEIATRGTAFAEANHSFGLKTDWTFREAILDAMGFTEEQFQACMNDDRFHKSCTYVMEYLSNLNRIVTRYEKPEMVLLTVVSNITFIEATLSGLIDWVKVFKSVGMNVRMPKIYNARTVEAVKKLLDTLEDLEEGFVLYDPIKKERIKIKTELYCIAHKLRGNGVPTRSNIIELVIENEQDELLAYFPEFKEMIDPVVAHLHQMLTDADVVYLQYHDIHDQKEFALKVKDMIVSALMFKARKAKTSPSVAFHDSDVNFKTKLLDRYLECHM